jgi:enamine deaminase RidA (YjgF/YER057c/UK114 family)
MIRAALALFLLAGAGAAGAQDETGARDRATVLMSEHEGARAFQEQYGFADAVITEDGHVHLSGVVVGLAPGETDLEAAYARTYAHIGNILERAGASWADVIDIMSFHTDLTTQLDVMAAVQRRHIAAPFPAWTAIQVSRLVPDRGLTEIRIVALVPPTE